MAGGLPTYAAMPGETEDDTDGLATSLADLAPERYRDRRRRERGDALHAGGRADRESGAAPG